MGLYSGIEPGLQPSSGLARNADFRRFARVVKSPAELLELLHEMTEAV